MGLWRISKHKPAIKGLKFISLHNICNPALNFLTCFKPPPSQFASISSTILGITPFLSLFSNWRWPPLRPPQPIPTTIATYDVFLNHRGSDVKKTVASYLYRHLLSHGLRVFLDQHELQQGDYLTSQIESSIRTASVHVAVFSARYAESNWCLNELLLMLESNAPIIPVFYHVKPSDLRWTRGKDGGYAQALQKLEKKTTPDTQTHEEKLRYDSNIIENWRNALSTVADISGFDLEMFNGDEGELLEKVVETVLKKVKKTRLNVAKYPTGLDDKVKDFEYKVLLQNQRSGKPRVVGIVGLGGVGKTTLAKELFKRKSSHYSTSCFLFDVRENAGKNSLIFLQRKLLKSLTGLDKPIDSIDEGIETIKQHLSSCHALIILDDVDHVDQVDALVPDQTGLCSDSLVLITSRDNDVLTSSGVEQSSIYKLTGLNQQYSRELFCSHAFSRPYPLLGFESLVNRFLEACDGLPLSLKVFGALLCGKNDTSYWEDQLDSLQQILPTEIMQRLAISYEALDIEDQQIFLDIACFFIGKNRDMAIRLWKGSGWKGLLGFQNLQHKCLVDLDSENNVHMHDHLRDLGRVVAEASLPRRLWRCTNNIEDLLQSSGLTNVRGIRILRNEYNDNNNNDKYASFSSAKRRKLPLLDMKNLQFLDIEDSVEDGLLERILGRVHSPNLIWLRWYNCPYSSLPSWIPMKNLRVLEVQGNELETLWQGELQIPLQLRQLHIYGALSVIPNSIGQIKHLERICVSCAWPEISTVLEEFCNPRSLKDCKMKSLPDSFGNLINLQHIDFSFCKYLQRLPNSFGNLIKLKHLDLRCCSFLTISTETLGNINTLEYIDFSDCEGIQVLPPQVAHQRSLKKLNLDNTNLKELPIAIGELNNLEVLWLGSPLLNTVPPSIGDLRNLKELNIWHCPDLKCLPASVAHLTQLAKLTLWDCALRQLPFKRKRETVRTSSNLDSSRDFTNVDSSRDFTRLSSNPCLLMDRREIAQGSFDESVCPNLQHLIIEQCDELVDVETLPNTLIQLELNICYNLKKLEGLCGLVKLQNLHINWCEALEELPSIETLVSLEELWVSRCVTLKSIKGLASLTKLRILNVSDCYNLEELEGIEHCISLEKLNAARCTKLDLQLLQEINKNLLV